jgi:hypothetical protein
MMELATMGQVSSFLRAALRPLRHHQLTIEFDEYEPVWTADVDGIYIAVQLYDGELVVEVGHMVTGGGWHEPPWSEPRPEMTYNSVWAGALGLVRRVYEEARDNAVTGYSEYMESRSPEYW